MMTNFLLRDSEFSPVIFVFQPQCRSCDYFHVSAIEASNLLNTCYAGVEQTLRLLSSPNLASFNKSGTGKKAGWGGGE